MKISIITATHNAAATIADCLASVTAQTVPIEHIIIDGASTDTTLDIVSRLTPQIPHTRVISEPDHGIYDAMNKGIALATGDVIGILNADDFYASPDVLARVAAVFQDPAVEACYGDLIYIRGPGTGGRGAVESAQNSKLKNQNYQVVRYWKSDSFKPAKFHWGWMPPHPTFFVRKTVYEKYGLFRLDMGSAADYELMLRFLLKHRIKTVYIPKILVKMRVGGVSNATIANRLRANRMDRLAWHINELTPYLWTLYLKPLRKLPQYLFLKKIRTGSVDFATKQY